MSPNPLLAILDLLDPYLPHSLTNPLYTLLETPSSALLSDPSQLLPLALTLFATYAAFLSFYSTLRTTYRFGLFALKWGTLAVVVGAGYSAYNNVGTEQGAMSGLRNARDVAQKAYGVGRTGIEWWMGSNQPGRTRARTTTSAGRRTRRGRGSGARSASGAKRTWATATDDGGWDDPEEVDLGAQRQDTDTDTNTADVMGFVKRAAMTFLAPGNNGNAETNPRRARAQTQAGTKAKKTSNKNKAATADDMGSLATEYAKKAFTALVGGGFGPQ